MLQPYVPAYPLSRYIQCLWYIDTIVPYRQERILPTGTLELIINFGAPFRVLDHDDPTQFQLSTESWLVGIQTEYILNEITAESHMIGVRFKPGGLFPFIRVAGHELHNRIVPLDLIWGRLSKEIRERLYLAPTINDKFRLLECLLLEQLQDDLNGLREVEYAVLQIQKCNGILSIKSLSDDIGISSKHLNTQFKKLVGVSPKVLSRILRFQQALNQIDTTQPINWVEIAYACDYYDQAHFNKDFAAFTGMSPSAYIEARSLVFDTSKQDDAPHFVPVG